MMMWKRLALVVLAFVSVGAQQPPDESHLPDSEKRIPPGHYCKSVPPGPRETKAHLCPCQYSCKIDGAGNVTEAESSDCLSYCKVNGRRCTCWPEGDPSQTCTFGEIAADDPILVPPPINLMMSPLTTIPGHTAERNERINGKFIRFQQVNGQWQAVSSPNVK
jgi:hypothetical protein